MCFQLTSVCEPKRKSLRLQLKKSLTYKFSTVAVVQVLWTVKLLLKLTVPLSRVAFPTKRIVNVCHNFGEVLSLCCTFPSSFWVSLNFLRYFTTCRYRSSYQWYEIKGSKHKITVIFIIKKIDIQWFIRFRYNVVIALVFAELEVIYYSFNAFSTFLKSELW